MKFIQLILVFLLLCKIIIAQEKFECYTPDETVTLRSAICSNWDDYIPVDPYDTPIKNVRITFHIIQKTNGSGNFPDNSASYNWLHNTLMQSLNSRFANFEQMNLPTSSPVITDSRIRFSLANIYFWQDDYGWSYQQTWDFGNYLYNKFVVNKPNVLYKNNSVHIFMCEDGSGGLASGIGDKNWITVAKTYTHYLENNHWSPRNLIGHELGHSLGLRHTWLGNDDCDDTPNNPNCWNVNNPDTTGLCEIPSNNLMDENACVCAVTICQVNRMHTFLLGNGGNIGDCLINTVVLEQPTVYGSEVICHPGETYTVDNLQLGVVARGFTSPFGLFSFTARCGNQITFSPATSGIYGKGQITYIFDWINYGSISVERDVWVGKAGQLDLCEFNSPIYNAEIINIPGSSCQPFNVRIESGNSVLLRGNEINIGSEFEVEIGGVLEIENSECN